MADQPSTDDDILYHCRDGSGWVRATVRSRALVVPETLDLNLTDGQVAVDVSHGLDEGQWATLDEVAHHLAAGTGVTR